MNVAQIMHELKLGPQDRSTADMVESIFMTYNIDTNEDQNGVSVVDGPQMVKLNNGLNKLITSEKIPRKQGGHCKIEPSHERPYTPASQQMAGAGMQQ